MVCCCVGVLGCWCWGVLKGNSLFLCFGSWLWRFTAKTAQTQSTPVLLDLPNDLILWPSLYTLLNWGLSRLRIGPMDLRAWEELTISRRGGSRRCQNAKCALWHNSRTCSQFTMLWKSNGGSKKVLGLWYHNGLTELITWSLSYYCKNRVKVATRPWALGLHWVVAVIFLARANAPFGPCLCTFSNLWTKEKLACEKSWVPVWGNNQ